MLYLADSNHVGHGLDDQTRLLQGRQIHQPCAITQSACEIAGSLDGKRGLPDATSTDQRDLANGREQSIQLHNLLVSTEKGCDPRRKIVERARRLMGKLQRRVLEENLLLEAAKLRRWFDPELFAELLARSLVGAESVALAPRSIQRQHQQTPETLAKRMLLGQRLQLAYRLGMFAYFGATAGPLWGNALLSDYPLEDVRSHRLSPTSSITTASRTACS